MKRLFATSLLLLSLNAGAAEPAFIVGVATHLFDGQRPAAEALQSARMAGVTSVRDDAYWSSAELQPGDLQILPAWHDYLADTREGNLLPVLILGYGNQYYDNTAKPRSAPVREGFGRYVDFVTRQLAGQVGYYEIWNEWDIENTTDRRYTDDYAWLVQDTAKRIRRNDPQVKVLAGAVTSQGMDDGFADRLIAEGALRGLDGLSLHPYVHCRTRSGNNTPESWIRWLSDFDTRISTLAGEPVPLYLTEMSWPSSQEPCGVSQDLQAAYLARSFFLARTLPNVRGMWWYDLFNDGKDPTEREHNFGLLHTNLSPKPAYSVLKLIAPIVTDYRFDTEHSLMDDGLYLLRFNEGNRQVLVGWSIRGKRDVTVVAPGPIQGPVRRVDTARPTAGVLTDNGAWQCDTGNCKAKVTFNAFPQIIDLGHDDWLLNSTPDRQTLMQASRNQP